MNKILLMFILIIPAFSIAQPVTDYYDNGQIRHSGTMKEGKKDGKWEFFYPSGIKEAEEYYLNDMLHGKATNYDFDGNKIAVENWSKGNLQDSASYLYSNGKLEKKGIYRDGLYEGTWIFQYESGMLKKEIVYKNGFPHGTLKYYSESGILLQEGQYENGLEDGEWKFYTDKGWLQYIGSYDNGEQVGDWFKLNKKGKKSPFNYKQNES